MSRDLTTKPGDNAASASAPVGLWPQRAARMLVVAVATMALIALVYQIPVRHSVDVGGYDAAYTRGFFDPERAEQPGASLELAGSDGAARWTRAESFLLFPQIGLPAELRLRVRAPDAPPVDLAVYAGPSLLGRTTIGTDWQELRYVLDPATGIAKPEDVLISLRSTTQPHAPDDPRRVGVLLDQASLSSGFPSLPYPAQLAYGALAGALLALLTPDRRRLCWLLVGGLVIAFLALYRAQPLYPYPLRGLLPTVVGVLAAALAWRHAERIQMTWLGLPDALAIGGGLAWLASIGLAAREHLVLSVPGVEKDFRVFATRATIPEIFHADGFYNLGYPLLLWIVRPATFGNAFLAAQVVAWASAAVLLGATWWLARTWLGRWPALAALAALALNAFVVEYSLYVGSDMPFAALCALTLALLLSARRITLPGVIAAGVAAGMAFLVRHPGLALLPLGWLAIAVMARAREPRTENQELMRCLAVFSMAWLITVAPQLVVNVRDTGQLFYSQQSKNVWLAVFGDGDWGRWGETSNDISLSDVVLQDPDRFAGNLWNNLRAFAGTGAEDTSEFGRAIQLRLLGFPANLLALAGLLAWLAALARMLVRRERPSLDRACAAALLAWLALYVPAICIGFVLPRFFLPLTPVYAISAAWMLAATLRWLGEQRAFQARLAVASGALLAALLWGGIGAGSNYVLRAIEPGVDEPGQPAEALSAARLLLATLGPADRLVVAVPAGDDAGVALGKYSALAHHVVAMPANADVKAVQAAGARFVLWSQALGPAPSFGAIVGRAGPYVIYQVVNR